jgi:hypothetical protein
LNDRRSVLIGDIYPKEEHAVPGRESDIPEQSFMLTMANYSIENRSIFAEFLGKRISIECSFARIRLRLYLVADPLKLIEPCNSRSRIPVDFRLNRSP